MDDLVERRNEVAHRAIPDEIQSYERLLAKVDFIDVISLGLVASLAALILSVSIENGETVSLGIPAELYQRKRVAVIACLESPVSEGDCVLLPGSSVTRWGHVLEIQVDDKRVSEAPAGVEVGLLLDFEARKNTNLLLWRTPNSELASPPEKLFGSRGPIEIAKS